MTKIPGMKFSDAWASIDYLAMVALVKQLAAFSARTFQHQLSSIGSIYRTSPYRVEAPKICRNVSAPFLMSNRHGVDVHVHKGPFRSSREWLTAILSLHEHDRRAILDNYPFGMAPENVSDAEADLEDATRTLGFVNKLRPLLDRIFPNQPDL